MPCEVHVDKKGTLWMVPAFEPKDVQRHAPLAQVEVWWNRGDDEKLIVRQPWEDQAQVVMLSLGQAYDLIDALNRAVEGN